MKIRYKNRTWCIQPVWRIRIHRKMVRLFPLQSQWIVTKKEALLFINAMYVKWRSVCSTYCKTLVPLLLFHHIAYWNSQNQWKLTLVHFFRERTNFNYTCKRKYRTRAEVANIKPDGIIGWFFLKQKHQCFVDVCNTKMNVQKVEHK